MSKTCIISILQSNLTPVVMAMPVNVIPINSGVSSFNYSNTKRSIYTSLWVTLDSSASWYHLCSPSFFPFRITEINFYQRSLPLHYLSNLHLIQLTWSTRSYNMIISHLSHYNLLMHLLHSPYFKFYGRNVSSVVVFVVTFCSCNP